MHHAIRLEIRHRIRIFDRVLVGGVAALKKKKKKYGASYLTISVLSIKAATRLISLKMGKGTVAMYFKQGKNPCVFNFRRNEGPSLGFTSSLDFIPDAEDTKSVFLKLSTILKCQ